MKKILSLMMLLVAIVTGAKAADETLFLYQSSGSAPSLNTAIQATGGTATWSTNAPGAESAKYDGSVTDADLKPAVKGLKFGKNASNVKLVLTKDLQDGDIIYISGYNSYRVGCTETEDNRAGTEIAESLATGDSKDSYKVGSVTITAAMISAMGDNLNTIYLSRANGSGTGFAAVKIVRPDQTVPSITAADATVKVTESGVAATVEVPVTGANLTGSTLTATLSGAPTGMSVALDQDAISAGAISATATVSYSATENAKGTATLTFSDGTTTKDVTITYVSKVVTTELQTTSEARTWNFGTDVTYNGSGDYELDDTNTEFVYTDLDLTFADNFDSDAIAFKGQYPIRSNAKKYAQAGTLHIKTSVAGTIKVKFSDTGSTKADDPAKAPKRYLQVNGEDTEYWTSRGTSDKVDESQAIEQKLNVETGEIAVAAGDIYLSGSSALIYIYVTFTPAPTETITIPSDGVLTYVTTNALDFSSVNGAFTAYVPTGVNAKKTSVTTAEVTSVPAGTALLIKGDAGEYNVTIVASADAPAENIFLISDGNVQGADNIFAYSKSAKQFKKVSSSIKVPAGKCYLQIDGVQDALDIDFEGEATAVDAIAEASEAEAAPVKVIKNGKLYIGNYNVAGQQVK